MLKSRYTLTVPGRTKSEAQFDTVDSPYDLEPIAEVEQLDSAGMALAIKAARQAFERRRHGLPAHERAAILERLATKLEQHHGDLSLLIAREGGKPLVDARAETTRAVNTVRLAATEATRLHGEEVPMSGTAAAVGRLALTIREPIGPVAAVSAFNHPLNLIAHQVAPAVAAGCPVLIKPAADTALSCMVFMEFLAEAGLPPEWGMAVPCSNDVAEQLVTSDKINFFSFIGSARIGWMLRSKLAPGVRCTLEHGGAAPVIVDRSADLDRVVAPLIKGGYYHAGQVCVSVQRVFAHDALRAELVDRLVEGARNLTVGDPTEETTDVGPLIRGREVDRVHTWVEEARNQGAQVRTGAEPLEHQCYSPTVLVDAPSTSRVMNEEIFGPVVVVTGFDTLDDAIARANRVPWSFQAAIFSQDIDRALIAARRLEGSAVMINDHTAFRVDWMPFAGRGQSGLGVGGVGPAMRDLSQEKLIVFKVNDGAA